MKKESLVVLFIVFSSSVFAGEFSTSIYTGPGLGFSAPNFQDHTQSQVTDAAVVGDIVYDDTTNQFYGRVNTAGQWAALSPPTGSGVLVSAAPSDRVERGSYIGNNCDAAHTPCTLTQSGTWFNGGIVRTAAGAYTITFATGIFSSAPTCVCNANNAGGSNLMCFLSATSATAATMQTQSGATGAGTDAQFTIVCQGPR